MTIRKKMTLLITAAGFLVALLFSAVILWEMAEEPFRILDAELQAIARQNAAIMSRIPGMPPDRACALLDDGLYWIHISTPDGATVFRSQLASRALLDEPATEKTAIVDAVLTQPSKEKSKQVAYRARTFLMDVSGQPLRVCVARSMEKLGDELWDIGQGVVAGLGVALVALLISSYVVAGIMLRPLRVMGERVREISETHLDRRIPVVGGQDEFNILGRTLNRVFDRLQHAFVRQKRLLADASHELKTPLTMIRLAVDDLRQSAADNSANSHENLDRLVRLTLRMERLVKSLLDLSALELENAIPEGTVDARELLLSLAEDYRLLADERRIRLDMNLPQPLPVRGSAEQFTRAFSNILDNALKYNEQAGQVLVEGHTERGEVLISVGNSGPGVAGEETARVFEQFYRVESSRAVRYGGSGLGLAIVKRIIELHDGTVRLESRPGEWTVLSIRLPLDSRYRQA